MYVDVVANGPCSQSRRKWGCRSGRSQSGGQETIIRCYAERAQDTLSLDTLPWPSAKESLEQSPFHEKLARCQTLCHPI